MKVVVDTNVLVSGLLFGGVPGQILTAWTAGAFVLVVSPSILTEYRRVGRELAKGRPALDAALDALLALIAVHATVVDAAPLDALVSADPDDEQFLAAACAGDASWIVSGDKQPFSLRRSATTMRPEHRYEVILYWSDADQAFIGEVPELPGCAADGPTYAAALEADEGVIAAWIATAQERGREIPTPKGRLLFA